MRRFKESRGKRNRTFGKNAVKMHIKNVPRNPMRGGIRL